MTNATKLTITDAFELPRPEDIRAAGFVIKLREAEPDSAEVKQLVTDYVITPAVEKELPRILDDMKQVFDRGEEYGRFIHGSFGSGKSHLMTMLAMLLENVPPAWDKFRPLLDAHKDELATKGREAPNHSSWIPDAKLLVVRIHMLSVRGRTTGLDRAIYDGFNDALKRRGKAPFEFLNVDAIFGELRREASEFGDIVWERLQIAGIVGGKDDFESVATGSPKARERFARAWLDYKGRDASQAGIDPRWSEGLKRMGEHAKAQGFGGIVLMIDEFLLWLAEKTGQEFVREINNLNVIVDHNTGQRPAPVFVFVARQRDLREFFPDLVDESKIHEHLDHHAKRFEETKLQDVELRHIVRGRVLRPRNRDAVKEAIARLSETHQKLIPALLADADIDYLRDVYPFHPALIEMLVDVTSLMQRERSALRLLYELLVLHYPNLPLGEFLPVGSAFAAIFPQPGVEASKKVELMQDIHHQYYARLGPAMQQMREDVESGFDDERSRALDQIVKTVLLAEVSPRLKRGGLTVERLVQLNSVDVEGDTFRQRVRIAGTDLLKLQQLVPDLQIAGEGKSAIVRYILGRVSLTEVINRAKSKVDNTSERFKVFWDALREALSVSKSKGFEKGGLNDGDWELLWRGTKRKGRLKFGNVREMQYDDFDPPPGTFKVLVDYPWDEPGHTVDEDRLRANNVRAKKGLRYTVCWLPRHMSTTELDVITQLAAVNYLLTDHGQEELLDTYGPQDRNKLLDQASTRKKTLTGQLNDLIKQVYIDQGEFLALVPEIDRSRPRETLHENLKHIATVLMDRRYPQHPQFPSEVRRKDLELLLQWMVNAGESNVSVAYDDATGKALKNLGQPLELVNLGQTKASLRLDSRYVKDVLQRADKDSVLWAQVAEHLRETYGLTDDVSDLFLCFLCSRDHRALDPVTSEPIPEKVKIGMNPSTAVRLQRGAILGGAEWSRIRELGHDLFGLSKPPALRSLQVQDRFLTEVQEAGRATRTCLQGLHARIAGLGIEEGDRLEELAQANERLGPLHPASTDSFKILNELLEQWSDDASDPLRRVVASAQGVRDALGELNENARRNLEAGRAHAELGTEVEDHLESLRGHLSARQSEQPLSKPWVQKWNEVAQKLVHALLQRPAAPEPGPVGRGPGPAPREQPHPQHGTVLCEATFDPHDAAASRRFLDQIGTALKELPAGPTRIVVHTEDAE